MSKVGKADRPWGYVNPLLDAFITLLVPTTILVHLYFSPYTKVEESFNIQATHDILTYGVPTRNIGNFFRANYDHVEFPGSVPRTFLGALFLAGITRPFVGFVNDGYQLQMLIRGALGLLNSFAILALRDAVSKASMLGSSTGVWYALLQCSQFHLMYYASRTLPNMFAFAMTTFAFRYWLLAVDQPAEEGKKSVRLSLYLITVAGVLFRSELAILVATMSAWTLIGFQPLRATSWQGPQMLNEIIPAGLLGAGIALVSTITIDTFFWQSSTPVWPEWSAFYYNTILGKSSDWGVSPFYYYFANALPKLFLNPLATFLVPFSILNSAHRAVEKGWALLIPTTLFIAIYSVLPHKEWRFIIYVIPPMTVCAAMQANVIWRQRFYSWRHRAMALWLLLSIAGSFAVSGVQLAISSYNYPGGMALKAIHSLPPSVAPPGSVFLDNLSQQTGVTRFLQYPPGSGWIYDKTENATLLQTPEFWQYLDYALMEHQEHAIGKWEVISTVKAFGGIGIVRPGEESVSADLEGGGAPGHVMGNEGVGLGQWSERLQRVEEVGRRLTRGWWVRVKMIPKIRILRRAD